MKHKFENYEGYTQEQIDFLESCSWYDITRRHYLHKPNGEVVYSISGGGAGVFFLDDDMSTQCIGKENAMRRAHRRCVDKYFKPGPTEPTSSTEKSKQPKGKTPSTILLHRGDTPATSNLIFDQTGSIVARISEHRVDTESLTRLLLAAPDMLDFINDIVQYWKDDIYTSWTERLCAVKAKALLCKINGEDVKNKNSCFAQL